MQKPAEPSGESFAGSDSAPVISRVSTSVVISKWPERERRKESKKRAKKKRRKKGREKERLLQREEEEDALDRKSVV